MTSLFFNQGKKKDAVNMKRSLTFGKPASSQSLIIPMKSVALAATNSGLNALITEFKSKALWESKDELVLCHTFCDNFS